MKGKISIWLKDNWFKLAIIVCIFIAIIGGFVKMGYEQGKERENSAALKTCLLVAESKRLSNWDSECAINSVNGKKAQCALPSWDAKVVDDLRAEDRNNCFKQYPQH